MSAKFAIIPGTGWKAVGYDDAVRKTARHENAKTRKTKDAETKNTGGNMTSPIQAFGIDIGGSGIKGAPVDLEKGEFAQKRLRIPTPENAGPDEVAFTVKQILDEYEVEDGTPVGVAFPAPVKPGRKLSFMANLAQSWVGTDVEAALSEKTGRRVHVINDADAAGLAEVKYGAAKNCDGLVFVTTLGTGIGTAIIMNGVLVPNTELGHLIVKGKDAETLASEAARSREDLSWKKWGKRLTAYYQTVEHYFSPDLFVVGGGVSKKSEKFFPYIDIQTEIVPADLLNTAGIVGAAYFAAEKQSAK